MTQFSGAATLLDVRRDEDYDAGQAVQRYLQLPEVKVDTHYFGISHSFSCQGLECTWCYIFAICIFAICMFAIGWSAPPVQDALGVPQEVEFVSCSNKVGEAMGPDVMRSVLHLLPDVVEAMPLLLYQGGCCL